jgi:hypothetical protein
MATYRAVQIHQTGQWGWTTKRVIRDASAPEAPSRFFSTKVEAEAEAVRLTSLEAEGKE